MAVYKESASVLFWSLAIMTYRARSFQPTHVPRRSVACFSQDREGHLQRGVVKDSFLHYLSCYVEFKSPAKCGTWEKCSSSERPAQRRRVGVATPARARGCERCAVQPLQQYSRSNKVP